MKSGEEPVARRRGRRGGDPGTREAVLAAARARFAERGYGAASIREIAADAGVDPALVHYFFGTKQRLFTAALALPYDPAEIVARALAGDPDRIGERVAATLVREWGTPEAAEAIAALIRSTAADAPIAGAVGEFIETVMIPTLAAAALPDHAELRAAQAASQIVGFMFSRFVLGIAPASTVPLEEIAPRLGAAIQRVLREPF